MTEMAHLHVHTEFSLLDGLSDINDLVKTVASYGQKSLAITDHGALYGAYDFHKSATAAGIKPIIGMEGYMAQGSMKDKDPKPYHLLMLAKNYTGYQNLIKISSVAFTQGFYYKPRTDLDYLQSHKEGLIVTSGCLAGHIPTTLRDEGEYKARQLLGLYRDIFGENFYLEVQSHEIEDQHKLNKWILEQGKKFNIPIIATQDSHYVSASDYTTHDTLLCVQTGALKSDKNRMRFTDNTYYITTPDELTEFADYPDVFKNTLLIAEQCEPIKEFDNKEYHIPQFFPIPSGLSSKEYLLRLCEDGLRRRYGDDLLTVSDVYTNRLNYELKVIHDMKFDDYFLIVWDLCEFAKETDIWWNVRGSGAGSIVSYCLGITNVDPISHGLYFERFLNPYRVTMPDIDIDFQDNRRTEMVDYACRKWGQENVAAIVTFGTMGVKASIKDVARALGMSTEDADRLSKLVPFKCESIDDALKSSDLAKKYNNDHEVKRVIDEAKELEGVSRQVSTHAAGIIIAGTPLSEFVPLQRPTGESYAGTGLKYVTQFPMETCESLGLLKIDFLGLATLQIVYNACKLVEQRHGVKLDLHTIPYEFDADEDANERLKAAFELISRGDTHGVFQVEGAGMTGMLKNMKPYEFEHIMAAIALFRPGPMEYIGQYIKRMHGEEKVTYYHPKLEAILGETYGIIVFQEQILRIASDMFGYTLGEADLMRRAVSKQKKEDLLKHRDIFLKRGQELDETLTPAIINKIFDDVEYFANYGFNKCLTGDTLIADADTGLLVPISEIVNGTTAVRNTYSLDETNLKIKTSKIVGTHRNGVKPVFKLKLASGREIKATENHPFYHFDGWKKLVDLTCGDLIAVPKVLPFAKTYVNADIFWDEIISIEPYGDEETYDLTIEGTHNFVANDIVVHNSHAADYATLTVQTAYLKAHYPTEFMLATLLAYQHNEDRIPVFLKECKQIGITLLPPDVNKSQVEFALEEIESGTPAIRFGLNNIKGVGKVAAEIVYNARMVDGIDTPFASLEDFVERVPSKGLNKKTLECFAKTGAFSQYCTRLYALGSIEYIKKYLDAIKRWRTRVDKANEKGKEVPDKPGLNILSQVNFNIEELPVEELAQWETQYLGLVIGQRPIDQLKDKIKEQETSSIEILLSDDSLDGTYTWIAGTIHELSTIITKTNKPMAFASLDDWREAGSSVKLVLFPNIWTLVSNYLTNDKIVFIYGKIDKSRGSVQIIVDKIVDVKDKKIEFIVPKRWN